MAKWGIEEVKKLLELYEREPCLYKIKHPIIINMRKQALDRIMNEMIEVRPGSTLEDIQRKLHGLRNQFNSEHRKVKESMKSGSGTDDVHVPTLWYYKHALFLAEHFLPRKSVSSKIGNKPSVPEGETVEELSPQPPRTFLVDSMSVDVDIDNSVDQGEVSVTLADHDYTVEMDSFSPQSTSTQAIQPPNKILKTTMLLSLTQTLQQIILPADPLLHLCSLSLKFSPHQNHPNLFQPSVNQVHQSQAVPPPAKVNAPDDLPPIQIPL